MLTCEHTDFFFISFHILLLHLLDLLDLIYYLSGHSQGGTGRM